MKIIIVKKNETQMKTTNKKTYIFTVVILFSMLLDANLLINNDNYLVQTSNTRLYTQLELDELPEFKGSLDSLNEMIFEYIARPLLRKDINAVVNLNLFLDVNGKLEDIIATNDICVDLDSTDLFEFQTKIKYWEPAKKNNASVRCVFTLTTMVFLK